MNHPQYYQFIDMLGKTYDHLTALEYVGKSPSGRVLWLFLCKCGNRKIIAGADVRSMHARSCGCLRKQSSAEKATKHGAWKNGRVTGCYKSWADAKYRVTNPASPVFSHYGGRGIKMCARWSESFQAFKDDMGDRPAGMTLERKDVNGDYEPSNCRWATRTEQANNKTNNRRVALNGVTKTLTQWCDDLKLPYHTIKSRLLCGWSDDRALTEPIKRNCCATP